MKHHRFKSVALPRPTRFGAIFAATILLLVGACSDADDIGEAVEEEDTGPLAEALADLVENPDTGAPLSDNEYGLVGDPCSTFNHGPFDALTEDTYEATRSDIRQDFDDIREGDIWGYDYMVCALSALQRNTYERLVLTVHYHVYTGDDRVLRAFNGWERRTQRYDDFPVDGRPWTHAAIDRLDRENHDDRLTEIVVLNGNLVAIALVSRGGKYVAIPHSDGSAVAEQALVETIGYLGGSVPSGHE